MLRARVRGAAGARLSRAAVPTAPSVRRLLALNALIRIAAAASGQLFAFVVAGQLGGSAATGASLVGLSGTAFFLSELAGAPYAGHIADRKGQTRVLRYGPMFGIASSLIAVTVGAGGAPLAVMVTLLLVARFTEGASAACAVPTTLVLISRATDADPVRRLRTMGLLEITSLSGMILGFVVAGLGWDALGSRAFLLITPLYLGAWLLVGRPAPAPVRTAPETPALATLRRLALQPGAVAFGLSWLAVNAVVGVWIQQGPYLLKLPTRSPTQTLVGGFSGSEVGAIFAGWGFTFLVGLALWSILGARWPRRRALAVALAGMLGVVAALAFVNHGGACSLVVLAAGLVLVESGYTPAAFAHLAELTRRFDPARGAVLGAYSLLLAGGQLIGTVIGAPFAARWQMDGVLGLTALLTLLALAGVVRMPAALPPEPRES